MISVHAYKVEEFEDSESLVAVLRRIGRTRIRDRTRSIGNRTIQAEHIHLHPDGYWLFDVSSLNFGAGPGRGRAGSETHGFQLARNEAFSELTACLYCPEKEVILVEYKHSGARSGSIQEYLSIFNEGATNVYNFLIKLDPQAMTRLGQKQVLSKLHFKVAPQKLRNIDRRRGIAMGIALDQTDSFGGQVLNVEIAVEPRSRSTLNVQRVRDAIDWLRTVAGRDEDAVFQADVTGRSDPDEKQEVIKLLDQKLEQRFIGYTLAADRRYRRSDRYDALERSYRGWHRIL